MFASVASLSQVKQESVTSEYLATERDFKLGESKRSISSRGPLPMTATVRGPQGFTKEFRHSGLGYSKNRLGAVVVENNAVS
jgi:hypothetical protein